MFSSDKKNSPTASQDPTSQTNRVSNGTEVKGDIIGKGDFRIDGKLEGNIETNGRVVVGQKGFVKGTIQCHNAEIEGRVEGNIKTKEQLMLKSTANIDGETVIGRLAIEPGAIFNGTCSMQPESAKKK